MAVVVGAVDAEHLLKVAAADDEDAGNLVKRYRYDLQEGQYSNPSTGASVPYMSDPQLVDSERRSDTFERVRLNRG